MMSVNIDAEGCPCSRLAKGVNGDVIQSMEKPRSEGEWCKQVIMVLEEMTFQDW